MRSATAIVGVLAIAGCGGGSSAVPDAGDPVADAAVPISNHLSLRGPCDEPSDPVSFPDTAVDVQSSLHRLWVRNDGPLAIATRENLAWSIEGPDAADFGFASSAGTGAGFHPADCASHRFGGNGLGVGQSCFNAFSFRPTSPGIKHATLRVQGGTWSNPDIDETFPLVGTAVAAPAALYTSSPDVLVDYYAIAYWLPNVLLIVNGGTTTVDFGSPVAPPPFTVESTNCPTTLSPGAACNVSVGIMAAYGGCPTAALTTTTGALSIPLRSRAMEAQLGVLSVSMSGAGSVHADPIGQTCTAGNTCSYPLASPTDVTLTAEPASGAQFLGWSSPASCGTSPTCVVQAGSPNQTVAVRADFTSANVKAVVITIAGTGTVSGLEPPCSGSCTRWVEPGGAVTLTAQPTGAFESWAGDCTGTTPTCNLGTIINDRAVTATFDP
ncbi:MAG TPA: hypothetical protein VIU61_07100 [Kofleriaceae bacterium]